jgi:hypothetical protein
MGREPLTPKQKMWCVAVIFVLNTPIFILIFGYADRFTDREFGVFGMLNLTLGVPLLALITEKWIRKMD